MATDAEMLASTLGIAPPERPYFGAAASSTHGSPIPSWRDRVAGAFSPRRSDRPVNIRQEPPSPSQEYDIADEFDDGWSERGDDDDDAAVVTWSWMDAEHEFPGIMRHGLTDEDAPSEDETGWLSVDATDDKHAFPGIMRHGLTDEYAPSEDDRDTGWLSDDATDDSNDGGDTPSETTPSNLVYGEWHDEDEARRDLLEKRMMNRRDRVRAGQDPEKSACWSVRNKNAMADELKRKFASSNASIYEACQFRCPCGFETEGEFCADRINLDAHTVLAERAATFSANVHGKGRLRLHAIRLKPNVQDLRMYIASALAEQGAVAMV